MSIPNPRPLERDGQPFNKPEPEPVLGMIEPWIGMYKVHEDNPKTLLGMTFHAYAGRYESRTMDLVPRDPKVYVPEGTPQIPISDQARRMMDNIGNWGPWVDNSGVGE